MRQYLLPKDFHGQRSYPLSPKEFHYLKRVLRFEDGRRFNGIDGDGKLWDLTLTEERSILCEAAAADGPLEKCDTLPSFRSAEPRVHLYQCLCKGRKDETITREATEAGVELITFVTSRYCTVNLREKSEKALEARNERLEAIIREAIQQSGSPVATKLGRKVLTLEETAEEGREEGLNLFFHQCPLSSRNLGSLLHSAGNPVRILIGSEGGFSDGECSLLISKGFTPTLLRTNILRAETAAIYAIAAVQTLVREASGKISDDLSVEKKLLFRP